MPGDAAEGPRAGGPGSELAADVSTQLLRIVMFAGQPERVADLSSHTRADVLEAGRSTAEIDGIVGESLERVRALREAVLGPDGRAGASVLVDLPDVRRALGETEVARALLERGLEIRRETLRPAHPRALELDQPRQAFAPDP